MSNEKPEGEITGTQVCYNIDFGNHLRCGIKIVGNTVEVIGAVNGWGDGVPLSDIAISPLPSPSGEDKPITKAFDEMREIIGPYWDKVACVCEELGKDKCSSDCPSHSDNRKPAPPEMTAEEWLRKNLRTNWRHEYVEKSGCLNEDDARHYANLRAAEAVREFAGELYGESMHKIIKDHMKFNGYFNFPQHAESYITNKLK